MHAGVAADNPVIELQLEVCRLAVPVQVGALRKGLFGGAAADNFSVFNCPVAQISAPTGQIGAIEQRLNPSGVLGGERRRDRDDVGSRDG